MFGFSMKARKADGIQDNTTLDEKKVLNAGQLPRLINLRSAKAEECACERCGNLIDSLRKQSEMLE